MAKRKKKKKERFLPTESERREVDLIMDRLRVQDPNGESFSNFLHTTKSVLAERRRLAAALLDHLSREGNGVCFQAFCALRDLVSGSEYAKVLRQAEYRFRQRGYTFPEDETESREAKRVALVRREVRKEECHYAADPRIGVFQYSAYVPVKGEAEFAMVVLLLSPPFRAVRLVASLSSRKRYKTFIKGGSKHLAGCVEEIPISCMARVLHELERMNRLPAVDTSDFYLAKQAFSPYFRGDEPSLYQRRFGTGAPEDRPEDIEDLMGEIAGPLGLAVVELWDEEEIKRYAREMESAQDSILVVPDHVKEQNKRDILKKAASHLFDPAKKELLARNYEEVSIAFSFEGEDRRAETYRWLGHHFREMDDAGESWVACALVDWVMLIHYGVHSGLFWPSKKEEEEGEGLGEHPSGLILPEDSL